MKTKNVRTTWAALLTAALLLVPAMVWGQTQGVRVANTDVTKVNETENPASGQLVDATANSAVEVTVTDKTAENKVAKVTVTKVTDVKMTSFAIGGSGSVTYGSTANYSLASIVPTYADLTGVTWTVTNGTGTATITASGVLTPTQVGNVTVTATSTADNTVKATKDVTISKAAASLTCNTNALSFTASNKKDATVTKTGVSASGGSVSVSSNNTAYCTVSYASGTITVKRVSEAAWTATITVSVTADGNHTWTESNKKTFTVSAAECVTDLSMVDNAGNARTSMTTANCYMVHKAGTYKLPLVYGNAIKDGSINSSAYTGVPGTNTTATFPNHADNPINAPWITKATTGSGVNKGMGYNVSTAAIVWQDATGLITAVGIDGDYLTLTVGKNATEQEGNAVIAAKTSDGTIVWSWHIWVTKQTFDTTTSVSTGSQTYKVAPVNLGWVGSNSTNTYYQWGRKDPFRGTGEVTYSASTTATIADNIKNPGTFYCNSGTDGPCTSTFYNMWDAQQTGTDNIVTATNKTVYDPCPPGFCVPTGNLYYYMADGSSKNDSNWDSSNKGKTYSGIFFPASGCRSNSSGTLYDVDSYGRYWSASPNGDNNGRFLHFSSSYWSWDNYRRAYGFPVRAVAE